VEKEGKKFVKPAVQQQPQKKRRGRRGKAKRKQPVAQRGIPITTMEVSMNLEGYTRNVYGFLEALYRQGLVSYPKSVNLKPTTPEMRW